MKLTQNAMIYKTTILTNGLSLITCFLFAFASFAQNGSLDSSFHVDGKVNLDFGGANDDEVNSVVIQSDGKIVVAGYSDNGLNHDFAVARYNSNGLLDNSFDTDGKVTTGFGSFSGEHGRSVAIQSDGKIVVAGSSTGSGYPVPLTEFALVRYNSNGSLDTSFNTNGKVTTTIGGYSAGHCMAIQSNGKIVVAGHTGSSFISSDKDFAVVRYNNDGSLDTSFGNNGIVTTAIGSSSDKAYSMVIQSDGKIVLAGSSFNGIDHDFAVVRYNNDGSLDNSFDADGKLTTAVGVEDDLVYSMAIQCDGKIVVVGPTTDSLNLQNDFAVVRYNNDGSLDNSFDTDGKVTTAIGLGNDIANSVSIQSDGKIVVAGRKTDDFAVVRYNSDGSLDLSFDMDGKVTTDIGGSLDEGNSMAIQNDGKIVVAGYASISGDNDFAIVRYNNNGLLNTSFVVTLGPDRSICPGQNTTLSAFCAGCTYQWWDGGSSQFRNITTPGTYWVTVTNGCGEVAIDSVEIYQIQPPVVDLGPDRMLCQGGRTTLGVFDPDIVSYQWSDGPTSPLRANIGPGTYSVTVTNVCGDLASDTIVINNAPRLSVDLGPDAVLCPVNLQLDATVRGGVNYTWSGPNLLSGTNDPSTITINQPGTYTVEVMDAYGCSYSDTIEVYDLATYLQSQVGSPTICRYSTNSNNSTTITIDTSQIPGASFFWNNGAITNYLEVTNSGQYWVEVTYGNCSENHAFWVVDQALPSDLVLPNDTVLCPNPRRSIPISVAMNNCMEYTWYYYNTQGTRIVLDTDNDIVVNPLISTTYYLSLKDTCYFCEYLDSMSIDILPYDRKPCGGMIGNDGSSSGGTKSNSTESPRTKDDRVDVYPNPNNGVFTIKYSSKEEGNGLITITNYLGQSVYSEQIHSEKGETTKAFSLDHLTPGMYFLTLQNKNQKWVKRLIIE